MNFLVFVDNESKISAIVGEQEKKARENDEIYIYLQSAHRHQKISYYFRTNIFTPGFTVRRTRSYSSRDYK